jgi:hypothetical protein
MGQRFNLNDQSRYIARDYFAYQLTMPSGTTLAPGAAAIPLIVTTDNDADFFWTKGTVHALVGSDATAYDAELCPEIVLTIKDTTTGRDMMNAPVPASSLFGTARLPFILPVQKYFGARAQISMSIANVSDNVTYSNVYFTFHGVKAFLRAGLSN